MCIQNDPVFVIAIKTFDNQMQRTLTKIYLLLDHAVEDFTKFQYLNNNGTTTTKSKHHETLRMMWINMLTG